MLTNLPNLLTLSRIGAIPLVVTLLWIPGDLFRWLALAVFVAACVTDYFDGYFARTWEQQSEFGKLLDPIADKLLVGAALLVLTGQGRIAGWTVLAALVILLREILVSGMREYLASIQVSMPVSRLAKWKTTIQMTAIGVLIVGEAGPAWLPTVQIGEAGLWVAAGLTLLTGYDYLRIGLLHVTPEAVAAREAKRRARAERARAKREARLASRGANASASRG